MKYIIAISSIIILLSMIGCSPLKPANLLNLTLSSSHYTIQRDIRYGKKPRQNLDIYTPNETVSKTKGRDKPTIVFVFGGAWKKGSKSDFKFVGHAFTQAGYRVVIPNYRLYPEVEYPDFIDDIADAVQYIDQQSDDLLGSDLSQGIILMGHSSGAHTAALLATDQQYFRQRKITAKLKALVVLSGPYDLDLSHPEVAPIFRNYKNPDSVIPARLVHRNMPPTLLLHGLNDTRVGVHHTQAFAQSLKQANVPHTMKLYKKVKHIPILTSIAAPLRSLSPSYRDITKFLSTL